MNRRERRALARKEKIPFTPTYSKGSKGVVTYEEFYGVGYERFNSSVVTIKKIEEEVQA